MKATTDELVARGFRRAGTVFPDRLNVVRVEIDQPLTGFVVYLMVVEGEIKKAGITGRMGLKWRMQSTFSALRQVVRRGQPYSGDPFKRFAPATVEAGHEIEIWAQEHPSLDSMMATETELNNFYRPEWTKEGNPPTRVGGRASRSVSAVALLSAAHFAAHKHRDQRRKDVAASPYINHPIAVATVLAVEGGMTDETILMAALLHDTVEDTETSFEEVTREFGAAVGALVREMTDDKSLSKARRKELQIEHAPSASDAAKQIKIADKICNVRDITHGPPAEWAEERRREYLVWAEQVVAGCRGVNPRLDDISDASVAAARG